MTLTIIADTVLTKTPLAGYPFRILGLLDGYSRQNINVQLFLCNRNFNNRKELSWLKDLGKNVQVFLISPEFFYRKSFLDKLLAERKSTIVQFENPELAVNSSNFIRKHFNKMVFVLDLHDLYYKRTGRSIDFNLTKKVLQLVDYTICFNQDDVRTISDDFGKVKSKVIYSPIFIDYKRYLFHGANLKTNNLLFMGNFYHQPNKKAAEFLINEVSPFLRTKLQDFHLHFLGVYPKRFLVKKSSFFTFHGFVKNRNRILKKIKLCLCPVFEGYGSRVKMLEYAAFGFPVLTTEKGMAGVENLKGLFLASKDNFAKSIIKILGSNQILSSAGQANRGCIKQFFNPSRVVPKLLAQITKKPKRIRLPQIKTVSQTYFPVWLKEKRHKRIVLKRNYIINEKGFETIKL
jgi:hypothetical protein